MDCIPKAVLRFLSDHKNADLLPQFPINILRQIWTHKLSIFDREFRDILNAYLDCDLSFVWRVDSELQYFVELNQIKRANNDTLKRCVSDIGSSQVLFNRSIANIDKYFRKALSANEVD